ncbi:GntR family transcriptional regulator [Bradyrhizobium erythrophlei]|jgi:GntR family transcriptional regulator, rspAB operon transcriptional repressor|uniref:Transcriptional regulator, GntR family n=1 Tax=Bradyrhizobium erythrophlei TaxID=1437360 RepID=A0A1M7T416_9BRAD|nr:GntR family transcriptional regulator [Bradyrhizobium erythrophlei]SHN65394.1 transcriptional regulator, GntR family [Bradyrhizobium erythrophlei]
MARKTKGSKVVAIRKQGTARPAKDGSLADAAYIALKEKIVRLFFLPGQYLNEGALCELLGVGRTPVHQALQRLQHDGLVEVMPRKGVIVQPGSISEILKILDSRVTIEADLARNAASRVTAEEAAELKKLARVKVVGDSRSQLDNFVEADRAFHSRFADLAGNPVMSDIAGKLHDRSIRYWYLHLWQTFDGRASGNEHAAIADAIARGDGEAAAAAVRAHLESLRTRLMRAQNINSGRPFLRSR